jgi:DNA-binding GntR family transcriptional regulator
VEGQAACILAEKNDPKIISALRKTIKKEEDIKVTTTRAYFEANRNIHRKFIELTDNRYLLEMFDMTWGKAMAFQLFATFENVDITKSLGDHLSLVDAIETGDKTVALEAFIDHINDGFNLQLKGLHAS